MRLDLVLTGIAYVWGYIQIEGWIVAGIALITERGEDPPVTGGHRIAQTGKRSALS